jgi:ribosomal protein L37AE/L43A
VGIFDRLFASRSAKRGPTCLACESTDLESLATDAYRCRACGHEGGDGFPAYAEVERMTKILALAPEARQALAERTLVQARNILQGIHLDSTRLDPTRATADVVLNIGFSLAGSHLDANDAREERDRAIVGAVRELAEAERLLADCGHALGLVDVLEHSITSVPARQFERPDELERHRDGLVELHARLTAELDASRKR